MAEKKPEDIMAEYLLKGGKMLAKECKTCGSPLFEYRGKTFCVVCAEKSAESERTPAPAAATPPATAAPRPAGSAEAGIEGAIASLCARVEDEQDERRCLTLMEAVRTGAEALRMLRQP
ncbi:autoantigen p27 domain-containing protein [uncultured Methanofollis sp.]|uniref:autoantigen p27 domain-containing protein n=1 Tax=uncultured Methanofollis sp. TaxID=262500 RepID=UPI0026282115|nr:autoantigen p27 domain-containing protein [uncultured Methanofollis sp.]